jgi:phage-related minor tail protein
MVDKKAMGGAITGGKPYLVGEMGPELILPSGSGQVMNAQRTEQILSSGINRGMQGMGSGGPAIVNAPVNTVNNSQSNMTSTSTPMFHPSPLLGAVNVAA